MRQTVWPDAQIIHGISPHDVAAAPTWAELLPQIVGLFDAATQIIIYNASFDLTFFPSEIQETYRAKVVCAMERLSALRCLDGHGDRWLQLPIAAELAGYSVDEWHRARADALACRAVWEWCDEYANDLARREAQRAKRQEREKAKRDAQIKVFRKNLRKRGATPDRLIKASDPDRAVCLTQLQIFKANREGEKWVCAGYGVSGGRGRLRERDKFTLYMPFGYKRQAQ